jgi:uncharacterized protein
MKNCMCALVALVIGWGVLSPTHGGQADLVKSQPIKDRQKAGGTRVDTQRKVVFHLDSDQEPLLTLSLENIKNLFKEIGPQNCKVAVVANAKAVTLFRKDTVGTHASDIEQLHKLGVHFKACRNAMAKNNVAETDLCEIIEVVPAGILELIDLQARGFAYIKP